MPLQLPNKQTMSKLTKITRISTLSIVECLARIAADTQHRATVITVQTVAVKQNAAKSVPFDNVHSLIAEITHISCRRFPEDQQLGILQYHAQKFVS